MTYSNATIRAIKKYEQEKIDKVLLRMPKGKKLVIKEHADQCGESVNAFINRAIDEAIARSSK